MPIFLSRNSLLHDVLEVPLLPATTLQYGCWLTLRQRCSLLAAESAMLFI